MMPRNPKKSMLSLGTILVAMDIICRVYRFLFDGARPIDRTVLVVDVLVLIVIIAEWIRTERRESRQEHASRERQRVIDERTLAIRDKMLRGQDLQKTVPKLMNQDGVNGWTTSVNEWIKVTQQLLASYSLQAEAVFLHDSRKSTAPSPMLANPMLQILLASRLDNIRNILEKPEIFLAP